MAIEESTEGTTVERRKRLKDQCFLFNVPDRKETGPPDSLLPLDVIDLDEEMEEQ
jgi:hypothetical protein